MIWHRSALSSHLYGAAQCACVDHREAAAGPPALPAARPHWHTGVCVVQRRHNPPQSLSVHVINAAVCSWSADAAETSVIAAERLYQYQYKYSTIDRSQVQDLVYICTEYHEYSAGGHNN